MRHAILCSLQELLHNRRLGDGNGLLVHWLIHVAVICIFLIILLNITETSDFLFPLALFVKNFLALNA